MFNAHTFKPWTRLAEPPPVFIWNAEQPPRRRLCGLLVGDSWAMLGQRVLRGVQFWDVVLSPFSFSTAALISLSFQLVSWRVTVIYWVTDLLWASAHDLRLQKDFVLVKNSYCVWPFKSCTWTAHSNMSACDIARDRDLMRLHVDFKTVWCVQRNFDFRFYSCSPLYPLPSAFKLKGTLAVFGFTGAGWITRRQVFHDGELIKVTGRFKRMKEGSWQLEITAHFLLKGEHLHVRTLDLLGFEVNTL